MSISLGLWQFPISLGSLLMRASSLTVYRTSTIVYEKPPLSSFHKYSVSLPITASSVQLIYNNVKRIWSLLRDSMLFAVPKKRVPRSRRRKRIKFQWLKPLKNIVQCKICNQPIRMHHICLNCFSRYKQMVIELKKEGLTDWNFSLFKNK